MEERFVTSRAEREWRDDRTRIGKTIQIPPRRTRPLHRYVTHLTSATLLRGNTTRKRHRRATAQCWRHACKNHSIRKWPWNIMRCLLRPFATKSARSCAMVRLLKLLPLKRPNKAGLFPVFGKLLARGAGRRSTTGWSSRLGAVSRMVVLKGIAKDE